MVSVAEGDQDDHQIEKAQRRGDGGGQIGARRHPGGGGAGEQPDNQNGQRGLEDLLQRLGAVIGPDILLAQKITSNHGGKAYKQDRGAQSPQSVLHSVHANQLQGDEIRPRIEQNGACHADEGKQAQRRLKDPLRPPPVAQGQPL